MWCTRILVFFAFFALTSALMPIELRPSNFIGDHSKQMSKEDETKSTVIAFLTKMSKSLKSKDENLISSLFAPEFELNVCDKKKLNKQQHVKNLAKASMHTEYGMITYKPSGWEIDFSVLAEDDMVYNFVLDVKRKQLIKQKINCRK